MLKSYENNYCASKRGGVHCLSIFNIVFAIIFGLFGLFLGSSLLTLGNSCFLPLFWCFKVASLGIVIIYGGTASFLEEFFLYFLMRIVLPVKILIWKCRRYHPMK